MHSWNFPKFKRCKQNKTKNVENGTLAMNMLFVSKRKK
jgi:hypothetical protein